jgi:hypothetical protein
MPTFGLFSTPRRTSGVKNPPTPGSYARQPHLRASGRLLTFCAISRLHHRAQTVNRLDNMSTLADELLQDFEDSGSEGEDQQNGGLFADEDDSKAGLNGHASTLTGADGGGMELDGDEEEVDEDEEMAGMNDAAIGRPDNAEEAKAKVEKMQLGSVNDVRSVASLMKTLEPVLEVSTSLSSSNAFEARVYIYVVVHSPDIFRFVIENRIFPVVAARKADYSHWLDRR